ncbi:cytochrome P450 monooxygenase pc-1 [Ceratobasidium sp. AG-I]|nr:cytochrome P450 monooxygenase pc-1 [Ceratobasidium sp. AG-I]
MDSGHASKPRIVWGPGLPIVLRRLPGLVLPPLAAFALATTLIRSNVLRISRVSPIPLAGSIWLLYKVTMQLIVAASRRNDRRKLGPNVVEVPKVKMNWPWNIDFMWMAAEALENGYVNDISAPFVQTMGNTFNFAIFGDDYIFTIEPEHIKSILSTDFKSFEKGQQNIEKFDSVLGSGVFNSDGEMWKFHRNMSRPYFSRDRVTHFDIFARHSDTTISKLLSRLSEPHDNEVPPSVDFQDLVSRFTMDSATEFLFGFDTHSLDEPLPYPHAFAKTLGDLKGSTRFSQAFQNVQNKVLVRMTLATLWPYLEMFWDRTGTEMRVVDEYIRPVLKAKLDARRLSSLTKEDVEETEGETLLDYLVQHTDDEKIIKDELFNVLLAGRDTTASTLTFSCYMLASNPHVLAKLRAEILDVVGSSAYPTPENLREMKYLRAVINEVLRLFPPAPLNSRECIKPTVFKSGGKEYFVPKGASCIYAVQLLHIRKDLWGPDAEEFDPERWLDHRHKQYVVPNPFIFLPFNAGPRICLGQQFAYNEVSFFLIRLLQRVDGISLAPESQPAGSRPPSAWVGAAGRKGIEKIWPKAHLTLYSSGGLWVRMKDCAV